MAASIAVLLLFFFQVSTITVSGSIKNCLGEPLIGAAITFSNQGGSVLTDKSGNFIISLPSGYSGIATPSKSGGYIFNPSSVTFTKIVENQICNFEGGLDADTDHVFNECDIQPQPTLISPVNNAVDQPLNLILSWNPVAEAATYRIQLSTSYAFTDILIDDSTMNSTSKGIGPLSPGTMHFWRVNEKNAGGTSEWSATWSFETILSLPDQVTLLIPANASVVGSDSVKFVWAKASPDVSYYELELAGDSTTTHVSFDTTITLFIPSKEIQKNYSWKVRAENSSGYGLFSDAWSFTRSTTDVSKFESNPDKFTVFQNYPNPFNPSTIFSFSIPSRSLVSLKIFDISGKEVATIISEELPAGHYTRQWYATQLPSGTYFCRLQAGSLMETKKLLLIK
jgi:hypothetical protein